MQYWHSFKEPTISWLLRVVALLGLLELGRPSGAQEYYGNGTPRQATLSSSSSSVGGVFNYDYSQNVSCIAHDAKFTCDCHNVNQHMLLPHLIGYVFQVEISNCKALTIEASALEETQGLRKITFKNINNLILHKNALTFPRYASNTPLIIEFEKVNFELIDSHAINGNIEEISFIGGRIDAIHPFGFSTLKERALLLRMDNVLIKRIEPQAFKKFAVEQMELTNCVFETNLPSKSFYELEVLNTLRIHNVQFKEVHTRAFSFKLISKLIISNNIFEAVDSEWLEAFVRDSAVIRENYFGATSQIAFKGISVHRDYMASEKLEMRFTNNTMRSMPLDAPPRALQFSERFRINIEQLRFENRYACKELDTNYQPARPKNPFFQTNVDKVWFYSENAAKGGRSGAANAGRSDDNQSFLVLSKIIEWDCKQPSYLLYILLGVFALVLILIVIAVIIWVRIARRNKQRKMDVVLPEPRTYKETQIIYQIENAGLLKTDL